MAIPILAVLSDYAEENWPSMDLMAQELIRGLAENHANDLAVQALCPPFHRRLGRVPVLGSRRLARNADRFFNRMRDYPRYAQARAGRFDCFHICDHSYAQLVHALPEARCGVFCHDLDTFASLLGTAQRRRPWWFRAMARRILRGMQKAQVVFVLTREIQRQILRHGLLDAARLVLAPPGYCPEFQWQADDPAAGATVTQETKGLPFLLNVGSCIARKRIDVLLAVFARLAADEPDLQLVQIGGRWTAAQRRQIEGLGIASRLHQLTNIPRTVLAEFYRQAMLVLQPSQAEGFGLPVIEALACGSPVLASDIPVLREVGGEAVRYAPVADVEAWASLAAAALEDDCRGATHAGLRLAQAGKFSWERHCSIIAHSYLKICQEAQLCESSI